MVCAVAKTGDLKASRGDFEAVDGLEGGLESPGVDGREATRLAGTADTLDGTASVDLADRSRFRSGRRLRLGVPGLSEADVPADAPRAFAERCCRDDWFAEGSVAAIAGNADEDEGERRAGAGGSAPRFWPHEAPRGSAAPIGGVGVPISAAVKTRGHT
jgi:hypothetical protein